MTVPATQVDAPCTGQVTCDDLKVLNPSVTFVEGSASTQRLLAVEVNQGQVVSLQWVMKDQNGFPIDLSTCGTVTVKMKMRESLAPITGDLVADLTGDVIDAANGIVQIAMNATHTAEAGVYVGEF